MLSLPEIVIVSGVVILLFGTKKLPQLGGALGETIKSFKKGVKEEPPKVNSEPKDEEKR